MKNVIINAILPKKNVIKFFTKFYDVHYAMLGGGDKVTIFSILLAFLFVFFNEINESNSFAKLFTLALCLTTLL